jgi:hypothetical protein
MPDSKKPTPEEPRKQPEPPDADACDLPLIIDSNGHRHETMHCASNDIDPRVVRNLRRQIDPATCERDYSEEEIEFMLAMHDYKQQHRRPFPTLSEVLDVLKTLGYRKSAAS